MSRTAVQLDDLRGHGGAVLDGVHAGLERHAHALGALHVSHHGKAELVRGAAGGGSDLRRHAQHAGLAHLGGVEHAARHEQLDHVGAVRGDLAHELRGALGTLGNLGEEPRAVPPSTVMPVPGVIMRGPTYLPASNPSRTAMSPYRGPRRRAPWSHRSQAAAERSCAAFCTPRAPQRIVELLHERTGRRPRSWADPTRKNAHAC